MKRTTRRGLVALSPIFLLLTVYLLGSIVAGDFYRIPIAVAFLVASIYAICITRGHKLEERIAHFSKGAADSRIMYMIWIFVLAGAFAAIAKAAGAVDATVALTLKAIPLRFLPAGVFIATCFISMSIGTSVGAIVALTPVVVGLATQMGLPIEWMVGIVVGGSFFGDNLSFISDTTIAATQTQGCGMKEKFKTNILLVTPAAIASLLVYCFFTPETPAEALQTLSATTTMKTSLSWLLATPYFLVIILALTGCPVLLVLLIGILAASILGVATGTIPFVDIFTHMGEGIQGMCELIIITMLAGGLLEIVRLNGGLTFLTNLLTQRISSRRGAEASISLLTMLANVCTANNTIAILTTGEMAKNIATHYDIAPRRSASLMDTASCFVQGLLPYGAQILMASGLAMVSPLAIIPNLYYPMGIGIMVIISILIQWPKK